MRVERKGKIGEGWEREGKRTFFYRKGEENFFKLENVVIKS